MKDSEHHPMKSLPYLSPPYSMAGLLKKGLAQCQQSAAISTKYLNVLQEAHVALEEVEDVGSIVAKQIHIKPDYERGDVTCDMCFIFVSLMYMSVTLVERDSPVQLCNKCFKAVAKSGGKLKFKTLVYHPVAW